MASSYQELKNRLQLLIDRADATTQMAADGTVIDMLDVFIANASKRFYRSEAARIPPLEKFQDYVLESGSGVTELALPNDYFETRYMLALDGQGRQVTLTRTSPENILNTVIGQSVSIPTSFAYGNNVWIIRTPNQGEITVQANYYGFLDDLSTLGPDTDDHFLLNDLDDLIVYWAAYDASLYYGGSDPTQAAMWDQRGMKIHDQVVEQENRQQSSGSTPHQGRPYRSSRSRNYGFY